MSLAQFAQSSCARVLTKSAISAASPNVPPPLAHYREHLAARSFHIFYNAPALIVICATVSDGFAMHDCCLAAQNLMLAAHAKALGTCWIGFAESWLNKPEGKNELGIPATHVAVAPIIIGHPATVPSASPRRPPEIIWFEP